MVDKVIEVPKYKEVINEREEAIIKINRLEETENVIQKFHDGASNPSFDGGSGRVSIRTMSEVTGLSLKDVSQKIDQLVREGKISNFVHVDSDTPDDPGDDYWESLDYQDNRIKKQKEVREELFVKRMERFRKLITRSSSLKLSQLSKVLEMEDDDVLLWLIDLPDEMGFTIDEERIIFDTTNINDHIDNLMKEFEKFEQDKFGKLE